MLDLSKAFTFEEYLKNSSEEKRKLQMEAYEKIHLSKEGSIEVEGIKETINIIVFSESYCPDCVVTLPFVKRIEEKNSNVKMYMMPLKGNEELLMEYIGEKRIPTVMVFNKDMEPMGVYIEMPEKIKLKMGLLSEEDKKEMIKEYRMGKYNNLIEEQLLDIIMGRQG